MNVPLKLGITGGIGSGKTSVCKVFSILGIPVFSADQEAKDIMNSDPEVIRNINETAGRDLYPGGVLNRAELARLIFGDNTLLMKVNSIVHPAVFRSFEKWTAKQVGPYVIMEAAILFESGAEKLVDLVATVIAPEDERMKRVIARSGLTFEQIGDRMRTQMSDTERIKRSDFVIKNSEHDMIIPAVLKINDDILRKIKTVN